MRLLLEQGLRTRKELEFLSNIIRISPICLANIKETELSKYYKLQLGYGNCPLTRVLSSICKSVSQSVSQSRIPLNSKVLDVLINLI